MGVNQKILKTTDGGITWIRQTASTSNRNLQAVCFIDDLHGWTAGDNSVLLKTTDGGEHWNKFNEVDMVFNNEDKFYVSPDENLTYILDENESLYTIEAETIKSAVIHVRDFHFINDNEGWYIDSTRLFRITAFDTAWVLQKEFENFPVLNTVFFRDRWLGIITGNNGKILKTINGGNTWRDISVAGENVRSAYFEDAEFGYAGDAEGGFFYTTNGGKNWTQSVTGSSGEIGFIKFYNRDSGFAVGEEGIFIIGDGGRNLTLFESPLHEETGNEQKTPSIHASSILPNNLIYARGKYILAANDIKKGTVTCSNFESFSGYTPGQYRLYQNFPNPFNAQTTISHTLPAVSHVSIKIYDLLGRQISELENSVKDAGTYKVIFDTSYPDKGRRALSSGIHFIRIKSGSWHDVRKMILLK